MSQGVLPYKIEEEKRTSGMTSLAGLPVYLDLASVLNLGESIARHLHIKIQGLTDQQIVMALILLNLAGETLLMTPRSLNPMRGFAGSSRESSLRDSRGRNGGRWRGNGEKRSDAQYPPHPSFSDTWPPSIRTTRASRGNNPSLT